MSKTLKILWFESGDIYIADRVQETAKRLGIQVDFFDASDLLFVADRRGAGIFHRRQNVVAHYDAVVVRLFMTCVWEALTVARLFREAGKIVVDESITDASYVVSKMHDYIVLAARGIAVPQTRQIFHSHDGKTFAAELGYPCVVKGIHGAAGQCVYKVESRTELRKLLQRYQPGELMVQEFLPAEVDYRINVIGYQAVPIFLARKPGRNDFRTNTARRDDRDAAVAIPISQAPHLRDIAEKSARVLRREFCGVDIRCRGATPLVLEVNRRPGFKGFEEATDYDLATDSILHVAAKCGFPIPQKKRAAPIARLSTYSKIGNAAPRQFVELSGAILPAPEKRWGGSAFKDDAFFLRSAEAEARRLVKRFVCNKATRLLDVGCGPGRLPIGILRVIGEMNYHGLDVHKGSIDWCKNFIGMRHPSFRFQRINAQSERYNPDGKKLDAKFRLPFAARSMDLIYLFAVFSHMREEDVRIYLSEFARILARDGRIFFTAFVEENVPAMSINPKNYLFKKSHGPLHVVRFEKQHLFDLVQEAGFAVEEFAYRAETGSQSGVYLRRGGIPSRK